MNKPTELLSGLEKSQENNHFRENCCKNGS